VAPGITQQVFANGRILHSAVTGAHALTGQIDRRWVADGASKSQEGLPKGELAAGRQQFVGGGLYLTPRGVRLVPGAIRDRYEELGGPRSALGLPTSDATALLDGSRLVTFDAGQLVELVLAGQHIVI
jgi:uncharacterized protein with LGFP repeats